MNPHISVRLIKHNLKFPINNYFQIGLKIHVQLNK